MQMKIIIGHWALNNEAIKLIGSESGKYLTFEYEDTALGLFK